MERCLACEADSSGTWWGEAPERPKGFNGGDVLNQSAYPGCISTLAEPRFYGVFSLSSCHILDPRLGEFPGLRHHRVSRSFLGAGCG
jgi:hypothetical protein